MCDGGDDEIFASRRAVTQSQAQGISLEDAMEDVCVDLEAQLAKTAQKSIDLCRSHARSIQLMHAFIIAESNRKLNAR